jgi:SIR2-like domain
MPPRSQSVDFQHRMLPLLVNAYERGRLVPFLGAGMSYPACALWDRFLENLERAADLKSDGERSENPTARAYLAGVALRNKATKERYWQKLREALQPHQIAAIPIQTRALARIWWPLVITTNYDDLFLTATKRYARSKIRIRRRWPRQPMMLVSRHPQDCRRILSSLVEPLLVMDDIPRGEGSAAGTVSREKPTPEIDSFASDTTGSYLWHIQGFLGGQADPHSMPEWRVREKSNPNFLSPLRFLDDLVVGHAEYRRVINTEIHFRRCFGEVFRQRSFLFLGSSLAEEYFLNLFGEVLELFGSNSYPHFALVKRGSVDARFLVERMNTVVCEYEDYDQLPIWIDLLRKEIDGERCRPTRFSYSVRSPFWISTRLNNGDFTVVRSSLPFLRDLPKDECVAVSSGRGPKGQVWVGPEIYGRYLKYQGIDEPLLNTLRLPSGGYVVRVGRRKCYAVAARDPRLHGKDARSLEHVHLAVRSLLNRAWKDGFCVLHLQLLASGRIQVFPPSSSLIETTRAYGQWRRRYLSRDLRLVVYVLDPIVLFNVWTGRIGLHELLSVDTAGFWLEVVRETEQVMRIPVQYPCGTTLGEILTAFRVPSSPNWHVWVRPAPRRSELDKPSNAHDLAGQTLTSLGVVPGSTLALVDARSRERSR